MLPMHYVFASRPSHYTTNGALNSLASLQIVKEETCRHVLYVLYPHEATVARHKVSQKVPKYANVSRHIGIGVASSFLTSQCATLN